MTGPLVLVAEDSAVVRAVLRRQLEEGGFRVAEAHDGDEALRMAREVAPAVILLDMEMPKLDGRGVLKALKADPHMADTPVVFLTGRRDTDDLVSALELGAHDYLCKPFENAELLARVSAAARVKALHDELHRRAEEMHLIARLDPLTGLYNRRYLDEHLRATAMGSRRRMQPLGVLMIDVDRFKSVNDTLGHAAGDEVLCEVTRRMRRIMRAEDVAGRWGGEEFLALLPQTDAEGAGAVAERIRQAVADAPVRLADREVAVTVSLGYTAGVVDDVDALVNRADAAMYDAKEAGRNRVAGR